MLILPNGYKEFQDMVWRTEPGKLDPKRIKRNTGFQTTRDVRAVKEEPPYHGYVVPKNFCPDCARNDVTPERGMDGTMREGGKGLWVLEENHPELHLQVGDRVVFWICHKCADEEIWGRDFLGDMSPSRRLWEERRADRRTTQLTEFIKIMILKGERPKAARRGYE